MTRRPAGPARLTALAVVLSVAAVAHAQGGYEARYDIPARPSPPRLVNDFAGALGPGEAAALEQKLVAYDDSTGTQIAVVVVPTTGGVAPADYAVDLGRAWGVGQAGLDNGVVVLVALEDRDVFIASGYGAEGGLTDAVAGRIVRNVIVPEFRRGNFFGGLDGATDAVIAALAGEFEAVSERAPRDAGAIRSVLCFLFVLFIVLVVVSSRNAPPPSSGSGRGGRRRRSGPGIVVLPGFGSSGGFGGGSGFGGGFGGGGFGGGFGGFGGGGFGGGGAGGSW